MTVDLRTRRDDRVPGVDAVSFFDVELPAHLDASAELLASAAHLELRPMVVEVDGATWLLARARTDQEPGLPTCRRAPADAAPPRLCLTAEQVADLVNDQITPVGLMTAGTLQLEGGGIGRLMDWWLVLRSVLDGVAVYTPGSVVVPDDLHRSFTLDDDPAEIQAFLESAGFVHLRGVFTAEEMARVSAEMDAAAPAYADGDDNSWWATLADGSRRLVRMQRFDEHSPTTAALLDDRRLAGLGDLLGGGYAPRHANGNRIEALFKPIGVTEGISDIPWHKDCSLGRHSYECCRLTIGISVTGAGPTSGQLRVVSGSHRALIWPALFDPTTLDLPAVALATETGDVTVHLSCTFHMAQPPTESERRVMYCDLAMPAPDLEAATENMRRLVRTSREGAPRHTSQPAAV